MSSSSSSSSSLQAGSIFKEIMYETYISLYNSPKLLVGSSVIGVPFLVMGIALIILGSLSIAGVHLPTWVMGTWNPIKTGILYIAGSSTFLIIGSFSVVLGSSILTIKCVKKVQDYSNKPKHLIQI